MIEPGLLLTRALFVVLAGAAWLFWARHRSPERLDTAAMLSSLALPVLTEELIRLGADERWMQTTGSIGLMLHPLLLLRMIWHFRPILPAVNIIAVAGSVASVGVLLWWPLPLPEPLTAALTVWFMALEALAAGWLLLGGLRARGVTRWRMLLIGSGSVLLAGIIGLAGLVTIRPDVEPLIHTTGVMMVVAAGVAYFLGSAPPARLRRSWQDSVLRGFLEGSQSLSVESRGEQRLQHLGAAAMECVGGLDSLLLCWSSDACGFHHLGGSEVTPAAALVSVWNQRQGTVLSLEALGELAERGEACGATCAIVVPVVSPEARHGILIVYLPAGLLFPEEDLRLLQLLGEQTAGAIEQSRLYREQLRLIRQLSEANTALQSAGEARSAFIAGVSHELRTPLNTLIGFAELLMDGAAGPISDPQRAFLEDILQSADQLQELLGDILDISSIEAGGLRLVPEPVDTNVLLSRVCGAFEPLLAERELTLKMWVSEEVAQVRLDPTRLRQILNNYISNAIKFTPRGGQIRVAVEPEGAGWFRLSVTDTGIGISPADRERLFKRFERLQTAPHHTPPGTGLGLALTRELVEAQQGEVGVESTFGVGSTFWARLPLELEAV